MQTAPQFFVKNTSNLNMMKINKIGQKNNEISLRVLRTTAKDNSIAHKVIQ